MQSALTTPTKAKREYANDGSLESVEGMLMKQATTYYPRVLALQLPMDFDDVMQELRMAYVKARAKWTPEKARFTTYCFTVARNEFNRRIERMVMDRQHLGLSSIDARLSDTSESDELGDGYERYLAEESDDAPEDRIERREELQARLNSLSRPTRLLACALLENERAQSEQSQTIYQLAVNLGLKRRQMVAIADEIRELSGYDLDFNGNRKPQL